MTTYIKLATLEYPRYQGDIRLEHREIGLDFVCPDTYSVVEEVPAPQIDYSTHTAYELPPENIDGVWTRVWAVRELTAEEIQLMKEAADKQNPQRQQNLTVPGAEPDVIE